jgi:hypothetical protein
MCVCVCVCVCVRVCVCVCMCRNESRQKIVSTLRVKGENVKTTPFIISNYRAPS